MAIQVSGVAEYQKFLEDCKVFICGMVNVGYTPTESVAAANAELLKVNMLWYPFNHTHEWNTDGLVEYARQYENACIDATWCDSEIAASKE